MPSLNLGQEIFIISDYKCAGKIFHFFMLLFFILMSTGEVFSLRMAEFQKRHVLWATILQKHNHDYEH